MLPHLVLPHEPAPDDAFAKVNGQGLGGSELPRHSHGAGCPGLTAGTEPCQTASDETAVHGVGTDRLHVEYGDADVPVGSDPIPNKPLGPDERHAGDEFGRNQRGGLLLRMA
jgi:hypothetical protein